MTLRLDFGRVRRVLTFVVTAAIVLTFAAQFMKDAGLLGSVTRFFDSDTKLNFPSVIKELALVASALGLYAISRVARDEGDRWAGRWRVLTLVVSLLALDEMMLGHQSLSDVLKRRFDFDGPLHFAWVVVYLPLAVAVFVMLARFWWSLPRRLRWSFAWAGVLFGGGSGLVALLKGVIASDSGQQSLAFYLAAAVSDSLELVGLAILVLAVFEELARRAGKITVALHLESPQHSASARAALDRAAAGVR
jgi:hypothetical protein